MNELNKFKIINDDTNFITLKNRESKERCAMKISEMKADLYCIECNDDTLHNIVYLNSEIKCVECEECNRKVEVKVDLKKEVYKEIYNRVTTKPSRISQEYKKDLSKFLIKLPRRVVSKPYRAVRYLNKARNLTKKMKFK